MAYRSIVIPVALLMVIAPALPAMGVDGNQSVQTPVGTVTNDEQHETLVEVNVSGGPEDVGRWLEPIDAEVPAVNLALLPGGDLFYYSGVEANESADNLTQLQFFVNATPLHGRSRVMTLDIADDGDVLKNQITVPTPETGYPEGGYDIFCSGITVTPEGTAIAPGATNYHTMDQDPENAMNWPLQGWEQSLSYDPGSNEWIPIEDMDTGRWYPSALQLPDGDTLVASGIQSLFWPNTYNTLLEAYDPDQPQKGWKNLNTTFQVAPGVQIEDDELPEGPTTGVDWIDQTHRGVPNLPMYPRLNVIPGGPHNGEVLYGANGDVWGPFGHHPIQPVWGFFQTLDVETGTWTVHETSTSSVRNLGSLVPLMVDSDNPQPRYLSFGGTLHQSTQATPTAEIIDATGETITSTPTDPMQFPRWSVNGVLLPDGSDLATGGSTYDNVVMHGAPNVAPLNVERFIPGEEPTSGAWETLPAMDDARAYHSTAVLLADGRVAVGGHVPLPAFHDAQRSTLNPQPRDSTFQVYEPAYLHHEDEDRPRIQSLSPANPNAKIAQINEEPQIQANFGDTITLPVQGLDALDSVTMLRPGAATHQYNADQLGIELTVDEIIEQGNGTKTVRVHLPSPDDLALAPGSYMVFVNEDANGDEPGGFYPSKAAWVNLLEPGDAGNTTESEIGAGPSEDENQAPSPSLAALLALTGLATILTPKRRSR